MLLGLAIVEFGLTYYGRWVASRERLDPGLLTFDSELGWQLGRNWNGRHVHYDFDARYSTSDAGLRGTWPPPTPGRARYVFVGDSFTFGIGVNDGETFVDRLGKDDPATTYLNAGIVGYSTDQEYLYLQRHLSNWRADQVILDVYLANDLLDNLLQYPLQAEMGKPTFTFSEGSLRLTNVPVKRSPKPPEERGRTLSSMVLGDDAARRRSQSWRSRWEVTRFLGLAEYADRETLSIMPERMADPLNLFVQLVWKIRELCDANNVGFGLLLLPGKSFVESPDGVSGQFQNYLREAILAKKDELRVPIFDMAERLRSEYQRERKQLFFPHEGHLNPAGHRAVAELLRGQLPLR